MARFHQGKILMKKNFILMKRSWFSVAIQVLFPSFTVVLLYIMGKGIDATSVAIRHPEPLTLDEFYQCTKGDKDGCMILLFGPDTPDTVQLMKGVANRMSLSFGSITGSESPSADINVLNNCGDQATFEQWIIDNENVTSAALFFEPLNQGNSSYTLYYNSTFDDAEMLIKQPLRAKRAVDEALLRLQEPNAGLKMVYRPYPILESKIQGEAIIGAFYGAPFFYLGACFAFIALMNAVAVEKESHLRFGMKMMGLKDSVYWITWVLTTMILNFFATLLMIAVGLAFGLHFFTNTNFFVLVSVFLSFQLSLIPLAFLCTVFISRSRSANILGFGLLLTGMFFMLMMANGANVYVWYKSGQVYTILRTIFIFIPFFNFSRCYSDVSYLSVQQHYSNSAGGYAKSEGYTWGDLYKKQRRDNMNVTAPPTADSLYLLLMNFAFFFLLSWYLDSVLPSSDGIVRPPYFFLQPSYWGFGTKKKRSGPHRDSSLQPLKGASFGPDVIAAEEEAMDLDEDGDEAAVRLVALKKVFRHSPFRKSKKDISAIKRLSIAVQSGSLFCLLGHNGAGKSTTVNVLVGLYPPTEGDAYVFGNSVRTSMDKIRSLMGVCPQHNILWDDLTAREHLQIFSEMKHVPKDIMNEEVDRLLGDVKLYSVGDKCVSTFSGGMKRRLSVAVSAVGDPKIIFMDEPTTGMDPHSRRQVWELIHRMKQDRVVFLTTHSMEEADFLADRIGIMVGGSLRCIGDSLHLKNQYGDGYQLRFVTDERRVQKLMDIIMEVVPPARLVNSSAGNVVYSIPFSSASYLPSVFALAEEDAEKKEEERLIKDWGVSHTTLEDVYLKITSSGGFSFSYS